MKQNKQIEIDNAFHSNSGVESRLTMCVLFLVLFVFNANAQFIKIDIEVPAKTGVSDMETSELNWQPNLDQSQQEVESAYSLTISSAENMQVMAILKHSEFLLNEVGSAIKLTAILAYRNDGKNKPPKQNASDIAVFPMSNSGLLIDNMKDSPHVLKAYLMVYTSIEKPRIRGSTYVGEILLTIEYN